MRSIQIVETIKVPKGVDVAIKSRNVVVKGPRGELKRSFQYRSLDIRGT